MRRYVVQTVFRSLQRLECYTAVHQLSNTKDYQYKTSCNTLHLPLAAPAHISQYSRCVAFVNPRVKTRVGVWLALLSRRLYQEDTLQIRRVRRWRRDHEVVSWPTKMSRKIRPPRRSSCSTSPPRSCCSARSACSPSSSWCLS